MMNCSGLLTALARESAFLFPAVALWGGGGGGAVTNEV